MMLGHVPDDLVFLVSDDNSDFPYAGEQQAMDLLIENGPVTVVEGGQAFGKLAMKGTKSGSLFSCESDCLQGPFGLPIT